MPLNDANWRWDDVRGRSAALFHSPHRLRVALLASVADADELYAGRIAREAKIGRKEATRELADFEAAGLLVAVTTTSSEPRGRGQPPRLLERHDQDAWDALQALGERFRRPPPRSRPRGS